MTERKLDNLGRPVLNEKESQLLTFYRLLLAAKDPDDSNDPLRAADEIALTLDNTRLLMLTGYREDILIHRDLVAKGIDPQETEEDIRREWFGI